MAPKARSIVSLLNEIPDELALPDLQRDFVWPEEKIRALLDTIMREYPFGSLLIWNTQFVEVVCRDFVRDFQKGMTFATRVKKPGQKVRMVLDGQQRLQSLYIAVFGSYDGRRLYFNATSGPEGTLQDDDDEGTGRNYKFEFWRDDESNRPKRLVRVSDVVRMPDRLEDDEIEKLVNGMGLDADGARIATRNLRRLRRKFREEIVPVEVLDDDILEANQARTIDQILDIFVRVNTGGTALTGSDLMFSLMKTKWVQARPKFDALLAEIRAGELLGIDKDFVIRGLLTIADAPPAFEVRNVENHWSELEAKFDLFATALKSAIDFCRSADMRIFSAKLFDPINTLLPLVYYLSKQKNGSVPDSQRAPLRAFGLLLLFNRFLSGRSPEARIRYLRAPMKKAGAGPLPLTELLGVIATKQRHHAITTTPEMLSWEPRLALNIAQPQAAKDTISWQEKAEVDHIFPQSEYRPTHGDLVDDIGNLSYLGKLRNQRKNAKDPWDYFKDVPDSELRDDFLVPDRALLAKEKFPEFVEQRRALVVARVKEFLGR